MTDFNLQATVKAGTEYDAPWVTIGADDPQQLEHYLRGLLGTPVLQLVHEVSQHFKAQGAAAPIAAPVAQQPPAQQGPQQPQWQQPVQQQQQTAWNNQPPQQQAPANNGAPQNGSPHPAGQQCGSCGSVLQYKEINSPKGHFKLWACPNGRRKGDGHESEFIR